MVLPVTTVEYGLSKAARSFNSRLDKSKLVENGFTPLPTWQCIPSLQKTMPDSIIPIMRITIHYLQTG